MKYEGKSIKECVEKHFKTEGYPFSEGNVDSVIWYLKINSYTGYNLVKKNGKYIMEEK